jgi:hypothetical protein
VQKPNSIHIRRFKARQSTRQQHCRRVLVVQRVAYRGTVIENAGYRKYNHNIHRNMSVFESHQVSRHCAQRRGPRRTLGELWATDADVGNLHTTYFHMHRLITLASQMHRSLFESTIIRRLEYAVELSAFGSSHIDRLDARCGLHALILMRP